MKIKTILDEQEIEELQYKLYSFFKTGYEFEEFLKEYLIKMGLDEVQVTQRSRDGGIDLSAIRKGVGNFSDMDITHYYIQAKKNKPINKVAVNKIRELKGTIPFGYKGIFITTSDFTSTALEEAINDISKPVVTINGKNLVMSCIDNGIGFRYKPIFSQEQMNFFLQSSNKNSNNSKKTYIDYIEKTITANDIRARIISIPSAIIKQFSQNKKQIDINVNNDLTYKCSINRPRNYLGGVTAIFKNNNMISNDGILVEKQSKWYYDAKKEIIYLNIED